MATKAKTTKKATTKADIRIVILQRGWVMVGRYKRTGSHCTLTEAQVVRRWGTTMGLGELATRGPLPETKLEPTPLVEFHNLTEVANIRCDAAKWAAVCV